MEGPHRRAHAPQSDVPLCPQCHRHVQRGLRAGGAGRRCSSAMSAWLSGTSTRRCETDVLPLSSPRTLGDVGIAFDLVRLGRATLGAGRDFDRADPDRSGRSAAAAIGGHGHPRRGSRSSRRRACTDRPPDGPCPRRRRSASRWRSTPLDAQRFVAGPADLEGIEVVGPGQLWDCSPSPALLPPGRRRPSRLRCRARRT